MAELVGAEHQLVAVLGLPTGRVVERHPRVVDDRVEMIEIQGVHGRLQGCELDRRLRAVGSTALSVPHHNFG